MQRFWFDVGKARWLRYCQAGVAKYLLICAQFDTSDARSLIGQLIAIHTYADGRVELRANRQVFGYTSRAVLKPASLTDTDPKSLHATLDKRPRARTYRIGLPGAIVTQGTTAAKKASAQKQV